MVTLRMSSTAVSGAAGRPSCGGAGVRLGGMFLSVAPLAKAFEVFGCVVHEIAVPMVHFAAASFATPLARTLRTESLRCMRGTRSRLGLSLRVTTLGHPLTAAPAVAEGVKTMTLSGADLRRRVVLTRGTEGQPARQAGFTQRVKGGHSLPIIMQLFTKGRDAAWH